MSRNWYDPLFDILTEDFHDDTLTIYTFRSRVEYPRFCVKPNSGSHPVLFSDSTVVLSNHRNVSERKSHESRDSARIFRVEV